MQKVGDKDMKEYEGFVKMTKAEFWEKQPAITAFPGKGWYKAGDLCFYEGRNYIAAKNTNCSPTTPGNWKLEISYCGGLRK